MFKLVETLCELAAGEKALHAAAASNTRTREEKRVFMILVIALES